MQPWRLNRRHNGRVCLVLSRNNQIAEKCESKNICLFKTVAESDDVQAGSSDAVTTSAVAATCDLLKAFRTYSFQTNQN